MKLTIIASGSKENCYCLHNQNEALIIELGVNFQRIINNVEGLTRKKIVGAIISHKHGDHAKYVREFTHERFLNCFAPEEVFSNENNFTHSIENKKAFKLGNFQICPFEVEHDEDCRCFCYLIKHEEIGTLLFATDLWQMPYRFGGLNHIMIEANHSNNLIFENIENEKLDRRLARRIQKSHLNFEMTKEILRQSDLSKVDNIILIHLSKSNADPERYQKEIKEEFNKNCYIAEQKLSINLNNGNKKYKNQSYSNGSKSI